MSERKAFNFYRSYYEIAKELPKEEREPFLMAILQMQFEGKEPNLKGMAKFAFISQKHSLDRQLEGYNHGRKGGYPRGGKSNHTLGGVSLTIPPKGKSNQVQDKGEEKEQEKDKEEKNIKDRIADFKISLLSFRKENQGMYSDSMYKEFFEYWSEHSEKDRKFRKEKEKSFDIVRRLKTWHKRSITFDNLKTKKIDNKTVRTAEDFENLIKKGL